MIKANITNGLKKLKILIFCFFKLFVQEIALAFLPILILKFISFFKKDIWSDLTFYNNLYIGIVTINAGNIFYLFTDCEDNDGVLKFCLLSASFLILIFSLIAYVLTLPDALKIDSLTNNDVCLSFSILCFCFISLTEFLKIFNDYRGKLS